MMMPMPMAMPMTMTTRMKTVTRAVVDGGRGGETMSSVSMWSSSSSSIERWVDEDETEAEAGTRATSEAAAAREAETEGSFAVALGTLAGGSATCYGLGSVLGIDLRGPGSVVTAIGGRSAYFALLNENPAALQRFITLCGGSEFLASQVAVHPLLLDDLIERVAEVGR